MMNWIRNWWRQRQRRIFRFWDGNKVRRMDPIVIFRGLRACQEWNMEDDIPAAIAGDEAAIGRCVSATRAVFQIAAFENGIGLTEDETLDVLGSYWLWYDAVKKNSRISPIPPESAEPPPPSPDDGSTTTNSTAASISTPAASNSAEPPVCVTASAGL